jgi:acyl carrier protein
MLATYLIKNSTMTSTPTQTQIKQTILNILSKIAPEADLENLKADEDIRAKLAIDSYDFLNLMIGLNEAFGVEIPEADYGKLVTIKDMISYLNV